MIWNPDDLEPLRLAWKAMGRKAMQANLFLHQAQIAMTELEVMGEMEDGYVGCERCFAMTYEGEPDGPITARLREIYEQAVETKACHGGTHVLCAAFAQMARLAGEKVTETPKEGYLLLP